MKIPNWADREKMDLCAVLQNLKGRSVTRKTKYTTIHFASFSPPLLLWASTFLWTVESHGEKILVACALQRARYRRSWTTEMCVHTCTLACGYTHFYKGTCRIVFWLRLWLWASCLNSNSGCSPFGLGETGNLFNPFETRFHHLWNGHDNISTIRLMVSLSDIMHVKCWEKCQSCYKSLIKVDFIICIYIYECRCMGVGMQTRNLKLKFNYSSNILIYPYYKN